MKPTIELDKTEYVYRMTRTRRRKSYYQARVTTNKLVSLRSARAYLKSVQERNNMLTRWANSRSADPELDTISFERAQVGKWESITNDELMEG